MQPSRKSVNDQAILDMIRMVEQKHGPEIALGEAVRWSKTLEVERLLRNGVPPNCRIPPKSVTPLMLCSESKIAQLLIESGADVALVDSEGNSALANFLLLQFTKSKARKYLGFLIKNGADPLSTTGNGVPFAELAKEKYGIDIISLSADR